MLEVVQSILLAVLVSATSVWLGGYVAIVVVARAATATLESAGRVALFRSLGRSYLWVGSPALLIALATGAILLREHALDTLLITAIVLAAVLVALLAVAVAQARRMSRLRHHALEAGEDAHLTARIRRGGHLAGILRAMLGILTVVLVLLGAFLAS